MHLPSISPGLGERYGHRGRNETLSFILPMAHGLLPGVGVMQDAGRNISPKEILMDSKNPHTAILAGFSKAVNKTSVEEKYVALLLLPPPEDMGKGFTTEGNVRCSGLVLASMAIGDIYAELTSG